MVITIIVILAIICLGYFIATQRSLVSLDEMCKNALSQIEVQLNSRWDAILALAKTASQYAKHESETLIEVIQRRRGEKMDDPATVNAQMGELSQVMGRLIAIGEAYPDLKANENFRELQVQLEGTENRINVERNNFNKAVQTYNVAIRKFPSNLLAGMFGFEKMDKFEAEAGAEKAPQVKF